MAKLGSEDFVEVLLVSKELLEGNGNDLKLDAIEAFPALERVDRRPLGEEKSTELLETDICYCYFYC
jgi:ATP/maltotriose-dependent transcriptional regulator MalT